MTAKEYLRQIYKIDEYGTGVFGWIFPEMLLEIIGNTIDNPELEEG